jgi:hypothetical protein
LLSEGVTHFPVQHTKIVGRFGMRVSIQKAQSLTNGIMNMFVVGNIPGEINIHAQMLFDDFTDLFAQSGIILFSQLVEYKFETERI